MFKDCTTLNELKRIIKELKISESSIVFREKKYEINLENQLQSLTNILYSECYSLKENYQNNKLKKQAIFTNIDPIFIEKLSSNNFSIDRYDDGWFVKNDYMNGYLEVYKGEKNKIVSINEVKFKKNPISTKIGEEVILYFPKEDRNRQPTFYYALSNKTIDFQKSLTRVYWNINSEGAPMLIKSITEKLNFYEIPFLFKCLNNPSLYFRRDAAVLYIEDENIKIVSQILPEIVSIMDNYLEDDVSLFSYKYYKGVGIAESPNNHESFGMNRMNILAGALLNASNENKDEASILNKITSDFIEHGIYPETIFLNKGSKLLYN
jgi:hypothetical protein